jgi:hypothetical protein
MEKNPAIQFNIKYGKNKKFFFNESSFFVWVLRRWVECSV